MEDKINFCILFYPISSNAVTSGVVAKSPSAKRVWNEAIHVEGSNIA